MTNFDPILLVECFFERIVDLSKYPYATKEVLEDLSLIFEECEPLLATYDPKVGSAILQELKSLPMNAEFTGQNFPLLFRLAQLCAHVIELEKFCYKLRDDQKLLDFAYALFIENNTGQNVYVQLHNMIASKQLEVLRSYGEVTWCVVLHGRKATEDLLMVECAAILCAYVHMCISNFFEIFSKNVLYFRYGPGSSILMKQGWLPGQGSGANGSGIRAPIEMKSYLEKRGLKGDDEDY